MLDQGQQGPDLLRTQHGGQFLDTPGSYEVKDGPRALQRPLGEEPHPIEMHAEGALGDFLRIQQEEDILAELRFAELRRERVHRGEPVAEPRRHHPVESWGRVPAAAGLPAYGVGVSSSSSSCSCRANPSHRVYSNKKIDGALEPRKTGGKRQVGGTTPESYRAAV